TAPSYTACRTRSDWWRMHGTRAGVRRGRRRSRICWATGVSDVEQPVAAAAPTGRTDPGDACRTSRAERGDHRGARRGATAARPGGRAGTLVRRACRTAGGGERVNPTTRPTLPATRVGRPMVD